MRVSKSPRRTSPGVATERRPPRRRKASSSEGTVEIIDRLLLRPFSLSVNGQVVELSTAEAIILQLTQKAVSGSGRAWQVILQYQEFANRHTRAKLELEYVDSDYTQSFAQGTSGGENGGR